MKTNKINNEFYNYIESVDLSNKLNLSSGLTMFVNILNEDKNVKEVKDLLSRDEDLLLDLYRRLFTLTKIIVDYRYENPNDTAIAVYLWILNQVNPKSSILCGLAKNVIGKVENLWWAKILNEVISCEEITSQFAYSKMVFDKEEIFELINTVSEKIYKMSLINEFPDHEGRVLIKNLGSYYQSSGLSIGIPAPDWPKPNSDKWVLPYSTQNSEKNDALLG